MRFFVTVALLVAAVSPVAAQEVKTDQDKTLYALGVALSDRLAPFALSPAELEMVKAGLTDGALGHPHKVEPREYMGKIQELHTARGAVVAAAEKKSGEAFLSNAILRRRFVLRACIVNFHTALGDVEALLPLLSRLGRQADAALRRTVGGLEPG